jgi:hypothetical protein
MRDIIMRRIAPTQRAAVAATSVRRSRRVDISTSSNILRILRCTVEASLTTKPLSSAALQAIVHFSISGKPSQFQRSSVGGWAILRYTFSSSDGPDTVSYQ